jgi:hypothetical protein
MRGRADLPPQQGEPGSAPCVDRAGGVALLEVRQFLQREEQVHLLRGGQVSAERSVEPGGVGGPQSPAEAGELLLPAEDRVPPLAEVEVQQRVSDACLVPVEDRTYSQLVVDEELVLAQVAVQQDRRQAGHPVNGPPPPLGPGGLGIQPPHDPLDRLVRPIRVEQAGQHRPVLHQRPSHVRRQLRDVESVPRSDRPAEARQHPFVVVESGRGLERRPARPGPPFERDERTRVQYALRPATEHRRYVRESKPHKDFRHARAVEHSSVSPAPREQEHPVRAEDRELRPAVEAHLQLLLADAGDLPELPQIRRRQDRVYEVVDHDRHSPRPSCRPAKHLANTKDRKRRLHVQGAAPLDIHRAIANYRGGSRRMRTMELDRGRFARPAAPDIIGHHDLAPWNIVFDGTEVTGIIDWDSAGPTTRAWDLAYAAYQFVPLHPTRDLAAFGWPSEPDRRGRLRLFASEYGGRVSVEHLVDNAILRIASIGAEIAEQVARRNPLFAVHAEEAHAPGYFRAVAELAAMRENLVAETG